MRKIVKAIKRQQMSGANGLWTKILLKFQDTGDQIFELGNGFGKYTKENLAIGQELNGYVSVRTWQGQNGQGSSNVFNGITADYVYSLLLKLKPDIESIPETGVGTSKDSGWEGGGESTPEPESADIQWDARDEAKDDGKANW